jgi:hypothetical protein
LKSQSQIGEGACCNQSQFLRILAGHLCDKFICRAREKLPPPHAFRLL